MLISYINKETKFDAPLILHFQLTSVIKLLECAACIEDEEVRRRYISEGIKALSIVRHNINDVLGFKPKEAAVPENKKGGGK